MINAPPNAAKARRSTRSVSVWCTMGLLSLDEAGGLGGVVPEAIGVDYARFEVSRQVQGNE